MYHWNKDFGERGRVRSRVENFFQRTPPEGTGREYGKGGHCELYEYLVTGRRGFLSVRESRPCADGMSEDTTTVDRVSDLYFLQVIHRHLHNDLVYKLHRTNTQYDTNHTYLAQSGGLSKTDKNELVIGRRHLPSTVTQGVTSSSVIFGSTPLR